MELRKQVCSLELAKKLRELDVKQESLFYWMEMYDLSRKEKYIDSKNETKVVYGKKYELGENCSNNDFSAFTVAELGEMLPQKVEKHQPGKMEYYYFGTGKTHKLDEYYEEHEVSYSCHNDSLKAEEILQIMRANTEADARAKMIVYLLEKKLLKP